MSLPWDTAPRPVSHARPETPPVAAPYLPPFEPQVGSKDEDNVDEAWSEELKESSAWFTKGFWAATGVRAVRTFAQTIVATVTAAGVGVNLSWYNCLLTSAGAAGLSVLMSIDRNMRS